MSEFNSARWREHFIEKGWLTDDFHLTDSKDLRHVTVEFAKHDHKLTELIEASQHGLVFKHGHFESHYLWSDITGVAVFKP